MVLDVDALNRMEREIQHTIRNVAERSNHPIFQHTDGRRLFLSEVMREGTTDAPIIGALSVVYAAGRFMSVDRIVRQSEKYKKKRRIIYYLDSRPGQIGSSLLLELLKIKDGEVFSKHKFVQRIDEEYFQASSINISSGEINEALSRMFRKTMPRFFGVEGREFRRRPFILQMQEISLAQNSNITYDAYKREIDGNTDHLIRQLSTSRA